MSQVICQVSHVTCHMSHVTCHMSHVTCQSLKHDHSQTVRDRDLTFWDNVHHPLFVTCHISHVTCHMYNLQNFITPKPLELGTWNFEAIFTTTKELFVPCHMPSFTCNMSNVTYHMSHVTCHMSHVKSSKNHHFQTIRTRDLKFWDNVHHPIFVTWHISHVMCHI